MMGTDPFGRSAEDILSQKLQETCGCGAGFCIPILPMDTSEHNHEHLLKLIDRMEMWRRDHSCTIRPLAGSSDWRSRFVGTVCTICWEKLTNHHTLTTYDGKPLHIACKKCYICNENKNTLVWTYTGDNRLLAHAKCVKRVEKEHAEQANQKSSPVEHTKIGHTHDDLSDSHPVIEWETITGRGGQTTDDSGPEGSERSEDRVESERDALGVGPCVPPGPGNSSDQSDQPVLRDSEGVGDPS